MNPKPKNRAFPSFLVIPRSLFTQRHQGAEQSRIIIFISEEIVDEISQVLTYPKIKKIYRAEGLRREDLIEAGLKIVKLVKVTKGFNVVLDHPADDKLIECASAAGADYIVAGDKHLKVGCYKKIRIVSANKFLEIIGTKR